MANEVDQYIIETTLVDGVTAPTNTMADKLRAVEAAARSAAEALRGAGAAGGEAGDKIGAASSQYDRQLRKWDDITAAAYRLTQAEEQLASFSARAATSATPSTFEATSRVVERLTTNVQAATAALHADRQKLDEAATAASRYAAQQELAARQTQALSAAQAQTRINQQLGVISGTSAENYTARAADIAAYGRALDDVRAKYDPAFAAGQRFKSKLAEIDADFKTGAVSVQSYDSYVRGLAATYQAAIDPADKHAKGLGNVESSARATRFATQQLGVQTVQLFSSIQAGQPILLSLIQQGHQVVDVMLSTGTGFKGLGDAARTAWGYITSPIGLAITGITAVAAATYVLASRASTVAAETRAFSAELEGIGRSAELSASGLTKFVDQMTKAGVSTKDAMAVISSAASNPSLSQAQISTVARLSPGVSVSTNKSVTEAGAELSKVLTGNVEATQKLAEATGFLDADTTKYVSTLLIQGERMKALGIITEGLETRFKNVQDHSLSGWTRFWLDVGNLATTTIDRINTSIGTMLVTPNAAPNRDFWSNFNRALGAPSTTNPASITGSAADNRTLIESEMARRGLTDDQRSYVRNYVTRESRYNQIDPDTGSGTYTSKSGNMGLFQLGVGTASDLKVNANDTSQNISGGLDLITKYWSKYHGESWKVAMAMVMGEGAADKFIAGTLTLAEVPASKRSDILRDTGVDVTTVATGAAATAVGTAGSRAEDAATQRMERLTEAGLRNNQVLQASIPIREQVRALLEAEVEADKNNLTGKNREEFILRRVTEAKMAANDAATQELATTQRQSSYVGLYIESMRKGEAATAATTIRVEAYEKALTQAGVQADALTRANTNLAATKLVQTGVGDVQQNVLTLNRLNTQNAGLASDSLQGAHWAEVAVEIDKTTTKYKQWRDQVTDPAVKAALDDIIVNLTDQVSLTDQARSATANLTAARSQKEELAILQRQGDLIGGNATAVAREIAEYRTLLQLMREQGADPANLKEEQRQRIMLAGEIAAQTEEIQKQRNLYNELSNVGTTAFDNITQAIVEAEVKGGTSAVNLKNVWSAALTSIASEAVKLSLLNPFLNWLFPSSNRATLFDAINVVTGSGSSGGGSGTSSSGGILSSVGSFLGIGGSSSSGGSGFVDSGSFSGVGDGAGSIGGVIGAGAILSSGAAGGGSSGGGSSIFGSLSTVGTLASLVKALFPETVGSTGSLFSGLGSSLGLTGSNSVLSGLTSLLNTPIGGLNLAGTGFTSATLGADASSLGLLTSSATIGSVLSAAGIGYGVGSLAGGYVQSAVGKTGYGPQIGAAAGTAIGIGSVLLAPETFGASLLIGGLIGGAVGGIGGGLIGPNLPNAYSSTYVGVSPQGTLNVGGTVSQLVDASGEASGARSDVNSINALMSALGVRLDTAQTGAAVYSTAGVGPSLVGGDYAAFQVGQDTPGDESNPNKFNNLADVFPQLRFTSENAGVAAGLNYRYFADTTELAGVTTSLTDFVNVLKGTQYEGATNDLINRSLNAGGTQVANADVQTTLNDVAVFYTQTVPGLLKGAQGSWKDALDQVTSSYRDAIVQAHNLGYAEQDLTDARNKAWDKVSQDIIDANNVTNAGYTLRTRTAQATLSGSSADSAQIALDTFDMNATAEIKARGDSLASIYGDTFRDTQDFVVQMSYLETALAAERLVTVQQNAAAILAAEKSKAQAQAKITTDLLGDYYTAVASQTGSPADANYANALIFNYGETDQRNSLLDTLKTNYGDDYMNNPTAIGQLSLFDATTGVQRQALLESQARTLANNQLSVNNTLAGFDVRYSSGLASASRSPLQQRNAALFASDQSDYEEQQSLYTTLTTAYGYAYAATQEYGDAMAKLTKAQLQDRINLEQQYADAAITSIQQQVSQIESYATSLQYSASSPLSATQRLTSAQDDFTKLTTRVSSGDLSSYSDFQTVADRLLEETRNAYGNGSALVDVYQRIADQLKIIGTTSVQDLTADFYAQKTEDLKVTLNTSLQDIVAAVDRLSQQFQLAPAVPARAAAFSS